MRDFTCPCSLTRFGLLLLSTFDAHKQFCDALIEVALARVESLGMQADVGEAVRLLICSLPGAAPYSFATTLTGVVPEGKPASLTPLARLGAHIGSLVVELGESLKDSLRLEPGSTPRLRL